PHIHTPSLHDALPIYPETPDVSVTPQYKIQTQWRQHYNFSRPRRTPGFSLVASSPTTYPLPKPVGSVARQTRFLSTRGRHPRSRSEEHTSELQSRFDL